MQSAVDPEGQDSAAAGPLLRQVSLEDAPPTVELPRPSAREELLRMVGSMTQTGTTNGYALKKAVVAEASVITTCDLVRSGSILSCNVQPTGVSLRVLYGVECMIVHVWM